MTFKTEVRLGLPVRLDVLNAVVTALGESLPDARVRYEGNDLVIEFTDPDQPEIRTLGGDRL